MDTSIMLTSTQSPLTAEEIARMRNIPYHEAVGTELDPTSPTPFKPSPDFPKIPEILTRKPSRKSFVIWRVRGCHMEDSRRISLVLRMQMEIWPNIAMQSPGTHLFDMVVLVLGALNDRKSFHFQPRKVNTSQLLMHQRKFSSFVPLSPNFTHHSLFQGSPISRMNETHRYSIPFHPLDRRKRIPSTHLLPNWRNGCWHPYEGSSGPESQALCSQTQTHVSLKGGWAHMNRHRHLLSNFFHLLYFHLPFMNIFSVHFYIPTYSSLPNS